ncbi:MAG: hypothetical protein WCF18_19210 [Chthoniobacteraceae bacterium]
MSPRLLDLARFLIGVHHRLPLFGREWAVRLVREGDTLAGAPVTEAGVAFFDGHGALFHWMPTPQFEQEFAVHLAAQRQAETQDGQTRPKEESGKF